MEARSIGWAILAAALYALNAPLSKRLLQDIAPTTMAEGMAMVFRLRCNDSETCIT